MFTMTRSYRYGRCLTRTQTGGRKSRRLSRYRCVGCVRSPRSHSLLWCRGFPDLPPSC